MTKNSLFGSEVLLDRAKFYTPKSFDPEITVIATVPPRQLTRILREEKGIIATARTELGASAPAQTEVGPVSDTPPSVRSATTDVPATLAETEILPPYREDDQPTAVHELDIATYALAKQEWAGKRIAAARDRLAGKLAVLAVLAPATVAGTMGTRFLLDQTEEKVTAVEVEPPKLSSDIQEWYRMQFEPARTVITTIPRKEARGAGITFPIAGGMILTKQQAQLDLGPVVPVLDYAKRHNAIVASAAIAEQSPEEQDKGHKSTQEHAQKALAKVAAKMGVSLPPVTLEDKKDGSPEGLSYTLALDFPELAARQKAVIQEENDKQDNRQRWIAGVIGISGGLVAAAFGHPLLIPRIAHWRADAMLRRARNNANSDVAL